MKKILKFSGYTLSREYLKNGMMDSIQIWYGHVTGPQGVPYFKVTLNSRIKKLFVEFTFFIFP